MLYVKPAFLFENGESSIGNKWEVLKTDDPSPTCMRIKAGLMIHPAGLILHD